MGWCGVPEIRASSHWDPLSQVWTPMFFSIIVRSLYQKHGCRISFAPTHTSRRIYTVAYPPALTSLSMYVFRNRECLSLEVYKKEIESKLSGLRTGLMCPRCEYVNSKEEGSTHVHCEGVWIENNNLAWFDFRTSSLILVAPTSNWFALEYTLHP